MADKINPKDFGFSEKDWKGINKQVRDWITLNKDLWNSLTKYEQKALKTSKDMAKNAKEASESAKEVRNLAEEHNKTIKNSLGVSKSLLSIRGSLADMSTKAIKLDQKSDALSKKRLKVISGTIDLTGNYLANMDAIGTDEFQSLNINKLIRDAITAKLPAEEEYLRKIKAEHDIQKKLNGEINAQSDLIKKPFEYVDGLIKRLPVVGDMLSKRFDLTGKGEDMANAFVEKARAAAKAQNELELQATGFATSKKGKQYRISKEAQESAEKRLKAQGKGNALLKKAGPYALAAAAAIGSMAVSAFNFAREMGVGFSQITPGMLLFKDETKAMLDEFGGIGDVSTSMLWTMKKASFFSGVQAGDMAKIAMLQTSITGDTKEMALDKQAKFMKDIKSEGLSASKVMGDLAANADMFAEFAKDGGKNMEEAAKQAAKMGLDLSATSAVAEKLLDWESSIAAEMEASMILGKSINLDKARQLAYSGDLAAMMTEVKNQAGGEAEFAKMTVVQRKSLGEAIGLTGAQLSEFMKADEEKSKKAAEQKAKQWLMIGAIAGAVIGMIGAGLAAAVSFGALTWAGIGWTIAALAAGGAAGGIIGAAIGGSVGAAVGDVFSPAKGKTQVSTKEGGLYNLSPNDDFMAAPGLINNMGGGSNVIVDNSRIESQNEQIISLLSKQPTAEQAESHSRKQKTAIEGAFAQR